MHIITKLIGNSVNRKKTILLNLILNKRIILIVFLNSKLTVHSRQIFKFLLSIAFLNS